MLANYYTAEQIASIIDVDIKRIWDWKRAKIITPALTKGEEQYTRADVVKLAVLLALKDVFGEKHGAPSKIVAAHSDELSAVSARLADSGVAFGPELNVYLKPTPDTELRVSIAAALRERIAQVPA